MSRLLGLRAWLRDTLWRRDADARMDEEMRFHLEMAAAMHQQAGEHVDSAARRARAEFGGVERHKDALRDGRRFPFFETLGEDLRFGARSMRRNVAFTTSAILTLSIGIGMATTMFSVVDGIALEERAVADAEEVDILWTAPAQRPEEHEPLSYASLVEYARRTRAFSGVAGVIYQGAVGIVMTDGARAVPLAATWVTGNFFDVLGVTPAYGRRLSPADDAVGAPPTMVISAAAWQKHFGGAPNVVGQRLEFNGKRFTIVGVMPIGFEYPRHVDAWFPVLPTYPATQEAGSDGPGVMVFDAVARRHSNLSDAAVNADFTAFLRQTDLQRRSTERGAIAKVTSFSSQVTGDIRSTLLLASAAVGLVLLISCVNVANLLLLRGSARTQELIIRGALGAGRLRLIRQLLTEAGLIAALGGGLALALSVVAMQVIRNIAPADIPHRALIQLNTRVLLVAIGLTTLAAIASGLLPAIKSAPTDLGLWLRGGRAISPRRRQTERVRRGLVVSQIALAVVVLVSTGLVTRSLNELQRIELGFDERGLIIVETILQSDAARTHQIELGLQQELLKQLAALPGVLSSTAMPKPPYSAEDGWLAPISAEGQNDAEYAANPTVDFEVVAANYFDALRIPLLAGRAFTAQDGDAAVPVAIVSQALAQRMWPGLDPVGRQIKLGPPSGRGPWMRIIGVASETRYRDLKATRPTLYMPAQQFGGPVPMTFAIRAQRDTPALREGIRRALRAGSSSLRIVSEATFAERIAAPLAKPRFGALLFATFGFVTLGLCVVGIYGVIASAVKEREAEFGIRLALGEQPLSVAMRVGRYGAALTLTGVGFGLALAALGARSLRSVLFGVQPTDPATFAAAAGLTLVAAALSCLIPAMRVARWNPMRVLRQGAT